MANTFQDQANERFDKATAFLNSSRSLLRNDLIYVSALADAVSAIKNMLQGYLYTQIAQKPAGLAPQSWQEAAASNSTPDLLRAAAEAGLRLPNLLGPRINQLNRDRNSRTHDDPKRLIDYGRAQEAIAIAEEVRRSVRAALGLASAPARSTAAQSVAATATPASKAPTPVAAATVANVPASAQTNALAGDDPDETDEDVSPASIRRGSRIRRFLRALGRVAAMLLLVVVGFAAGVGVMIPISSGHAPSWLSFATRLLPAPAPVAQVVTATPTATSATTGPIILGAVTVSAPECRGGSPSFALHNTGSAAVQWSVARPGSTSPLFTIGLNDTPQPALFGSLNGTSSVIIYVAQSLPVVVTTPSGAVQLALPAC
jgi:hypothetical protein